MITRRSFMRGGVGAVASVFVGNRLTSESAVPRFTGFAVDKIEGGSVAFDGVMTATEVKEGQQLTVEALKRAFDILNSKEIPAPYTHMMIDRHGRIHRG
jgi:kynureninase